MKRIPQSMWLLPQHIRFWPTRWSTWILNALETTKKYIFTKQIKDNYQVRHPLELRIVLQRRLAEQLRSLNQWRMAFCRRTERREWQMWRLRFNCNSQPSTGIFCLCRCKKPCFKIWRMMNKTNLETQEKSTTPLESKI